MSLSRPAKKLVSALTTPKVAMKESAALLLARPNSTCASRGSTVRSRPTIAPTNALTSTNSQNWRQLARRPSATAGAGSGCRIGVEATLIGSGFYWQGQAEIRCSDLPGPLRARGNLLEHQPHERLLVHEREGAVEAALEADRAGGLAAQASAADGPGEPAGQHLQIVGQGAQTLGAPEQRAGPCLRARGELGAAHVGYHERMPSEDEPRVG